MPFSQYAEVVLDTGLDKPLDYGVGSELLEEVKEGSLVQVFLRGRTKTGIVVRVKSETSIQRVIGVTKLLSDAPLMTPELFKLALWMQRYYLSPLPKVLKLFFPKSVRVAMGHKEQKVITRAKSLEEIKSFCLQKRNKSPKQVALLDAMLHVDKEILLTELLEKTGASRSSVSALEKAGLIRVQDTVIKRSPLDQAEFFPSMPKKLNPEQVQVLQAIEKALHQNTFSVNLLHGVTGSGKTEIYLQAIQKALDLGKTALMLVPEIALTTQTVEKFKGRFKEKIAILHHRLSDGERYDEWHAIRSGQAKIVIGARSSIFAPLQNIGLIIVDEEHEHSYKQTEESPTYQARDLAVLRGKNNEAHVLLGSATPSFESYQNAQLGKYGLLELKERVENKPLPRVQLVDMRLQKERGNTLFSDPLLRAIEDRYQKGEQSILFLNRRGYHTSLVCESCGESVKCPSCEVTLTFHLKEDRLHCHLCDYQSKPRLSCPSCKAATFKYKGIGTEKVEISLRKIFPKMRTLRIDADTTRHVGSYEKLYYAFRNQKADVLIGTQMIAKGLHFPNVTLVGVLNSDTALNLPDFRASEMAFQLLTQVAGRAGRGDCPGDVFIQTYNLDNPILKLALTQNYLSFFKHEIPSRQLFHFPPYTHLVKFVFKGKDEKQTLKLAQNVYRTLVRFCPKTVSIMEPLACGYPKIKENYRFQILLKCRNVLELEKVFLKAMSESSYSKNVKMLIDVDPSSTFF